ncbi:thymidylate synthase domain-containing protein [Ditylenchus destructor]|nr:thymidylate synthase domain-containing protein [Ditylenchus destructor]
MAENQQLCNTIEANLDEEQYLNQIRQIISKAQIRGDRTGTGTLSIFGMQARYSLRNDTMPLLTTKKVFWRAIVEELLWFIRGETNSKTLSEKGVKIWDANGSRAFLDDNGFKDREEGDLGPVYGFQWRHFGAEYVDPHADYTGKGVDQLAQIIEQIKNEPESRRIILCAWNAADLPKMALPPCHVMCQFFVADGELSCMLTQRSGDMGLGVPFNIASYALLTHMIAKVTNLKAGDFVHNIGDAHVYQNHIDALKIQLERSPRPFPKITFKSDITNIEDFTVDSICLDGYDPYPPIKMEMAV